ncbi:MAG: biotin carboxylase, partial [Myxococcota bacterium]
MPSPSAPHRPLTIAVTGLNATDNPGPGVSVIRALREHPLLQECRIIGLAYDVLEAGIYRDGLTDALFMLPYPSQGRDALLERLVYIHERLGGLDAIIPTLDAELPSFIDARETLAELGIGTFLPTAEQFELRSKARLGDLGQMTGISVPASRVVNTASELTELDGETLA